MGCLTKNVSIEQLIPIIRERFANDQTVRFSPRGVSMKPMLRQGRDSVVLSPIPEKLNKYDLVLYQSDNGRYILHRIVAVGDTYTCLGDNQIAVERGVRREQMIAVVTAFYRGKKYHSTQERTYRIYCVLWHKLRCVARIFILGYLKCKRKKAKTQ